MTVSEGDQGGRLFTLIWKNKGKKHRLERQKHSTYYEIIYMGYMLKVFRLDPWCIVSDFQLQC